MCKGVKPCARNLPLVEYINDNGQLRPADTLLHGAESDAALYGDGLFETVRVEHGQALLWERHWARLSAGCEALLLPAPHPAWTAKFLRQEIERTAEAVGMGGACRARLHVYSATDNMLCFTIACAPLPDAHPDGLRLGISTKATKDPGPLAHLKTCNALPYRVAARESVAAGWDDAVLLNTAGCVVETTKSNIFLVLDGTVFANTPAEGCIAGVMRAQVIEWMQEWGLQNQESSLTVEMLKGADAVFLTNAVRRVQAVRSLISPQGGGERSYDVGPVMRIARLVEQKFIDLHR